MILTQSEQKERETAIEWMVGCPAEDEPGPRAIVDGLRAYQQRHAFAPLAPALWSRETGWRAVR